MNIVFEFFDMKSSRYHFCSNVSNNEYSKGPFPFILIIVITKKIGIFSQITRYFGFRFLKMCRSWNFFENGIFLSSFGQSMKKIIMVKLGYFCVGQMMM
jgi:hypothetical protein